MSDVAKPSVQAFLVCDQVIEDSVTKKKSLIGLFTHLQAVSFPFEHSQMGLYFCLTDAEGTYHFDIDLIYLNNEQLVCRATFRILPSATAFKFQILGSISPHWSFPLRGATSF